MSFVSIHEFFKLLRLVYLQEDSSSNESYSEGNGSEEEVLTGDELLEDEDYDDEENDLDIEIVDDYDAESDLESETEDNGEENDLDPEEEDNPECNLSGSSSERSGRKGSDTDNSKVCAYSFKHKNTTSGNHYKSKSLQSLLFILERITHVCDSWKYMTGIQIPEL